MPIYTYIAKDSSGKSVKGKESALSEQEIKIRLSRKRLVIISMHELKKSSGFSPFRAKIRTSELVLFCKQLATMVKGGVPMLKAIGSIAEEIKNPLFKNTLDEIDRYLKGGESLSGGFRKYPNIFSPLFVSIVEAGEKVGSLDTMLERLSAYLLAKDRLNKKIIAALTYPSFVLVSFFGAMLVVTLWLVPKFKGIYSGFGAQLPLLTQIVFSFSDAVLNNIHFVIGGLFLAVFFGYRFFFKSSAGRRMRDNMAIRMPLLGPVVKNAALSKFARTLATLLSQGIPIAVSLELVSKASGNVVLEEGVNKVRALIMDGESVPEALRKAQIFPPLMLQMATVGVESGSLPELLDKTADFYEDRVNDFVATLTTMIEPILIVSLGIAIGIVIIALYLPIFKLSQAAVGKG